MVSAIRRATAGGGGRWFAKSMIPAIPHIRTPAVGPRPRVRRTAEGPGNLTACRGPVFHHDRTGSKGNGRLVPAPSLYLTQDAQSDANRKRGQSYYGSAFPPERDSGPECAIPRPSVAEKGEVSRS